MIIIGAGMAGLLAGAMLRDEVHEIIEAQGDLPNNHSAVLRFRSQVVAETLNIPFKPVQVVKSTIPWLNPVADALSYSFKATGKYQLRSILTAGGDTERRYIAPPDLIARMERKVSAQIRFGETFNNWKDEQRPIISTIPMPVLMKLLGWETKEKFTYAQGTNVIITLDDRVDAYCTLYVPDPSLPYSRVSLTKNQLIIEMYNHTGELNPADLKDVVHDLGMTDEVIEKIEIKHQRYGKINPVNEQERKQFVMWASEKFGVYSLGRFATWRPGLLLDDVVHDVRVIHQLIHSNGVSSYYHKARRSLEWTFN